MHHRRRFPHDKLKVKEAFVRGDPTISPTSEVIYDDYLTLSDRIAKVSSEQDDESEMSIVLNIEFQVIPRHKGFGTVFSHLKSLFLVGAVVGMELYAHCNRSYNPFHMFFMGFWLCFVMHNVGHESSHGSPSRKPWVNNFYQLAMSIIGGTSTLWWMQWHIGMNCILVV